MSSTSKKRVLLIGWDAADWEMIDPLLHSGQMPALAQIIRGGVRGNLATLQPVLSPMLWTSIATGKRADKHGICGFTEPLVDTVGIGPVQSTSRKCKALWNILTQCGLKSNIIGWFATNPAEPINGVMVTDQFLSRPVKKDLAATKTARCVHPPELDNLVTSLRVTTESLFSEDLLPFIPRLAEIDLKKDERPLKLARRLARVASVQAVATSLIQTEPWDLMAVYYDAVDQFGHEFMPYHPPRMEGVSEQDFALYQEVMRGCYRFHDMMLHALLQYVDANTTVILISDHGYECGRRRPPLDQGKKDPESCHRPFGIVCLKGPDLKKNERLYGASILDVTPTVLSLLNLPIGQDMDGRPWLEALDKPVQPERIFSWEGLGNEQAGLRAEHTRQDPTEAAQAIEQLVELGYIAPPSQDARQTVRETLKCNKINLIRALLGTPHEAEAIPLLQELAVEDPANEWMVLNLAQCQIRHGRLAEARAHLQAVAPTTQQTSQIQLLLAELCFAEGDKAGAVSHLEMAVRAETNHPPLLNQLGRALLYLERWDEAARAFTRSLELELDNPSAFDGMARVHLEHAEPALAVEASLQAVGLIHYFPEAHYHLGLGLERMGQAKEAILAFETALGLGYQPPLLHRRLAELYRPIDPVKAAFHGKADARSQRPRIYKAEISSKHPAVQEQAPAPSVGVSDQKKRNLPPDFITIVSGLPRSGTSLMMQMLQAGGMPILTDGKRVADEHNPNGYLELEAVKRGPSDLSWLEHATGQAVKVVHLLLASLPDNRNYRVIFMLRNLQEVVASQRAMLARQGRPDATLDDEALARVFDKQLATVRQWLAARPNFAALFINHSDAIARPDVVAEQVNQFLGGRWQTAAMSAAVNPTLHHQRASTQARV